VGSCSEKKKFRVQYFEKGFSVSCEKWQTVVTYIGRKKTRRWHILTRATDDNYVTFCNNVKLDMIM
jgi:hypothetical protein